jgi:ribose 1,5-bisphosphokinase
MLVLVVGPSGAGKDTLLNAARVAFRGDARISFARRVITRPPDPHGENHEPVTEAEFASREFALSWFAHGLRYGIPAAELDAASVTVVNVSRGVIAEAAARYPVLVIDITASPEILAERVTARGRETSDDVALRLARTAAIPRGVQVETVRNDGKLADAVEQFVALLSRVVERTAADSGSTG